MEAKATEPNDTTQHVEETPITAKTLAVLVKLEQLEGKLNRLQDVTEEVRELKQLQKELRAVIEADKSDRAKWKDVAYRVLREAIALLFSDRIKHRR